MENSLDMLDVSALTAAVTLMSLLEATAVQPTLWPRLECGSMFSRPLPLMASCKTFEQDRFCELDASWQ